MGEINQEHCSICGREFDIVDLVVHMDAWGPSFSYCSCLKCKRAWEIGQFKRGSNKIERREVEYKDVDIEEFNRKEEEKIRDFMVFE